MTGRRARAVGSCKTSSGRNTVARTTHGRREAATPRRFARSADQTKPARRFGRASARPSGGAPRSRRRQPEQSGAQKLMQGIRGMLPGGGGKSSTGRRSGRNRRRGAGGGRKPAIFGLLGAGAAGAAAAVAKRRHGSRSSEAAIETRDGSEAQATSTAPTTPAHPADAPMPGEAAQGPDTPPDPDTPTAGDAR
jgi:hypothetical protein